MTDLASDFSDGDDLSVKQIIRKGIKIPSEVMEGVGQKDTNSPSECETVYDNSCSIDVSDSVNTDTIQINFPSEDEMQGVKGQLEKLEKIRESMYTYIQKHRLTDSEMEDWRADRKSISHAISNLKYVLNRRTHFMSNWKDKVLDADGIERFESIYKRWN